MDTHEKCNNVGKLSAEDCNCLNCQSGNDSRSYACSRPSDAWLPDEYWRLWFIELMVLAKKNDITTSDDADLWWDDFGKGLTPKESMDGFLDSQANDQDHESPKHGGDSK
jgi:hypothetical protein